MPEEGFKHKLAAILSADVVGYSRLMSEDEVATIRTLSAYRDKICTHVHENIGRVVDFIGDNMLAEFSSALNAVDCAVKIQNTLGHLNTKLAENRQMYLRIGIDLGEILIDKDNLDAFLILAGANAALDRQNEASNAASAVQRIKPDFTLTKFAETQRYKDPKKLEQVTSMLRMAGLH